MPDPYPGAVLDDLESLNALASPDRPFDEAYALLSGATPRPIAKKAYDDFIRYWYQKPTAQSR